MKKQRFYTIPCVIYLDNTQYEWLKKKAKEMEEGMTEFVHYSAVILNLIEKEMNKDKRKKK